MNFFGTMTTKEAENVNSLVLAYIGDAVQSLFVREKLVHQHDFKAGTLHTMASGEVNAHSQSALADKLFNSFTEEEKAIFLRGRNGKVHHKAKNQSHEDYRKASGFEAVIGYLYLIGNIDRIKFLLGENN